MNLDELKNFVAKINENGTNVLQLEKTCNFLSSQNVVFDDDVYKEIFTITKIENIIKTIINEKLNDVTIDNIISLSDNTLFLSLIVKYCEFNNIRVIENDYEDEENDCSENLETYDSLRIYMKSLTKPILKPEEEKELGYRILNGDMKARDELIERNLKLVVNIVFKMRKRVSLALSPMDMISAGNEGLVAAADKYDVRTGFRFTSYATACIKQKIRRNTLVDNNVIKVPERIREMEHRYHELVTKLQNKLFREVTLSDVALATNLSINELSQFVMNLDDAVSLNQMVNDEDSELIEFIADDSTIVNNSIDRFEKSSDIGKLLSILNTREKIILECLYAKQMTLKEIGKELDISRERVRQIAAKALRNLRKYAQKNGFSDYMNDSYCSVENDNLYLDDNDELSDDKNHRGQSKVKNVNINLTKISLCIDEALANFDNIDINIFNQKKYSK